MISSHNGKSKPEFRKPIPNNIPQELKSASQWVVWNGHRDEEQSDGRWSKVAIDARTGGIASMEDSKTWADFETAYKAYQTGRYDGIGIVLTEELSLCVFDLGPCAKDGEVAWEVRQIIEQLETYSEYTPTGRIQALALGRKPEVHELSSHGYRVYDSVRFIAITGHHVNGFNRIERRQTEIESVCRAIFSEHQQEGDRQPTSSFKGVPVEPSDSNKEQPRQENGDLKKAVRAIDREGAIIDEMNKKHAVIMVGGKCRVLKEIYDPVFKRQDILFIPITDFHALHANKLFFPMGEKKKPISHSKLWLTSKYRREFARIVFVPPSKGKTDPIPSRYYNLWRGFGVEPKQGDWGLFRNHILDNICKGDEVHFRWLISWLARIVQDPGGERPGVAVVLIGKRGTGKSIFVNIFGRIFGQHFLHMPNPRHLTGHFNSHLKDRVLVFCDEGFWSRSRNDEGVLKSLITEPTLIIEGKGLDIIQIKNHINMIMATNNDWAIPAGLEERRFFVLEISDRHMQDNRYFKAICDQMESGGVKAMLHDLLEWDDPEVDLRKAPKTEALLSQIECTMNTLQKWFYQRLHDGENLENHGVWYLEIRKADLYHDYVIFAARIQPRRELLTNIQFGKKLKELVSLLPDGRESSPSWPNNVRHRTYCFRDLDFHRREFQEIMGYELDWETDI